MTNGDTVYIATGSDGDDGCDGFDLDFSLTVGLNDQSNGASTYFIHADHLGTPQALTDIDQNIAWRAEYAPFGLAEITAESVVFNLRFPGQYYDSETGLHYNYYRYYDPSTGRYITSDPIGLQGGLNTYPYVGGNPLRDTDPLGLAALRCQGTLLNYPHSWLCANGVCGGFYPDPNNVWWGAGKVLKDPKKPEMCEPVDETDKCDSAGLESCIAQANKIGTTGFYSFPLRNCRGWQQDVIQQCKAEWCPGG